ncbi:nucleolar protein 12-domain-containing protein [Fusarium flagelliforme]|uniref:Nucleolar protein 12 n=1 Tax=Fusarium flagelliforme TaxID=2675880 RepID=A0A395N3C4_9HYPO|nr:nucleolar protein 12-domain-containing protein [Fusarium flagelliforme]KAH7189158.1 nucleolar protein 12-domain-containing protein [Fusarium flagelliforme]RFN54622.1 nucleolar protein 12 [Fusarium flagelliforme]
MFAKPRPKKSVLPPQYKKRKAASAVEEVNFDFDARQEYLTGFHKRKLQRIKNAQEEAAKRARQEKLDMRKQIREERKREVEEHVQTVNRLLKESEAAGAVGLDSEEEEEDEEWGGIPDQPELDIVDHEEEYIDEDRYTTVKVESVSVTRDGFQKPQFDSEDKGEDKKVEETKDDEKKARREPKKKKKKFRYDTKFERQLADRKVRAQKSKMAARRSG